MVRWWSTGPGDVGGADGLQAFRFQPRTQPHSIEAGLVIVTLPGDPSGCRLAKGFPSIGHGQFIFDCEPFGFAQVGVAAEHPGWSEMGVNLAKLCGADSP